MQKIEIKAQNDHIQRIASANPLAAISELIWNAYDADASEVSVEFEQGALTKLGLIRVVDNGTGIPADKAESFFQALGGSWKRRTEKTNSGRSIHGEKGQGRFKAFALGEQVTWISKNAGTQFEITGNKLDLTSFQISEAKSAASSGCTVKIENIIRDFEITADYGFVSQVRDVFALQLYDDPGFKITYDGLVIEAREAIRGVTPYDLVAVTIDGRNYEFKLEIIEWKIEVQRKLLLCLPGRFSFHELAPGIHARGFNFTAYVTADHFQYLADQNTESLVELDEPSIAIMEVSKNKLREHFREKEAERSRVKIQEWEEAKIYPYVGRAKNPIESNERQVFDVVALNLADYSPDFERAPSKQKGLILQLIKAAIETGPGSLPIILEKVIDLPKGKQDELAELLRKTSLTAIINAAKAVTDRLDFLHSLQLLIFDPASKRQLLERSQLQRVISQETWIFGEQFNLMNDDQDLSAVLRSHIQLLGSEDDNGTIRDQLAKSEAVLDADGKVAIIDLMLSCRVPTPTDDERKHLVVELKRPSQSLNEDVISQIKKYAKAVALDDRFKHSKVEWDFVAIANRFTKDAELEARQSGKPRGLLFELDEPKIRVWAKTWGEIIQDAEGRLTFYKRRLEYQANDAEALNYLRKINPDYLSEEVKQRISSSEIEEVGKD